MKDLMRSSTFLFLVFQGVYATSLTRHRKNEEQGFIRATFRSADDSVDDAEWESSEALSRILSENSMSFPQDRNVVCERKTYSSVNPNKDWGEHPEFGPHRYQPQVWYHTMEETYDLWKASYFDYVIDTRTYDQFDDGNSLFLPGWKDSHIPGSYLIPLTGCLDGSGTNCFSLDDFLSNGICLDARIYVHCWVGVAANNAVEKLVQLGFTNLHATGPEGSAGFLVWSANGWETVEDDTYDTVTPPTCMEECSI